MTVETSPLYPSDLNASYPAAGDNIPEGDDHIRNIKTVLKTTFPNVSGAVTPSHTVLNYMVGVTSAVQTQLDAKAPLASPTLTGTPLAPNPAAGSNTTQIATMAAVNTAIAAAGLSSSLPSLTGNYRKALVTDAAGAVLSWGQPGLPRSARTSNTVLGVNDNGTLIDITSGTFSQTFSAVATLGVNWGCIIRNSGTGDVTLDPSGSEQIDGLTSFIMYPGEARLVQCDGAALRSIVLQPFYRAFTTTGTFTKPPGYSYFGGLAWSAGSSGQRTNNAGTASAGGGGGGCFPFLLPASTVAATETVTIGAGGAAVTTVANGNLGGNTTFGSLLTVYGSSSFTYGGAVGVASALSSAAGAGYGFETAGSAAGGDAVYGGGSSHPSATSATGSSIYGSGAGGGVTNTATPVTPGTSVYGGAGGAGSSAANGTAGTAPGGGGGATQTGTSSGAGARGEVRIWGIA